MAGKPNKDQAMLSAAEACAFLGIKAQTLYAYVSRGLLRAESHPGLIGKLYARDELEALQARSRARTGHGPTAASAMRWGDPILDSAITCIQAGQIYYRGYPLADLLKKASNFEQIAELLWSGELPAQRVQWTLPETAGFARESSTASFSRRLLHRISRIALLDAEGHDELADQTLRRARSLILQAVDELFPGAEGATVAQRTAAALPAGDSQEAVEAIEATLIASADHELNASTFAARVAASTGADLYAGILAALASFSGRHHGTASLDVYDFLQESSLHNRLEKHEAIPGLGHRLYPDGDPRVPPLLAKARALARRRQGLALHRIDALDRLIEQTQTLGCPKPNMDFALVAVALALDLPREGASSLFVLGRFAGWTAHIIEQRQQGFLLRPRARYTGRAPMPQA